MAKAKKAPTREQMIAAIVATTEDWTLDELLDWAIEVRGEMLAKLPDDKIAAEYEAECQHIIQEDA